MFSESAHSDLSWTTVQGYSRKENALFEQAWGRRVWLFTTNYKENHHHHHHYHSTSATTVIIINFRKGGCHCQPRSALLLYFSNWLGKSVPRRVLIIQVCEGLISPRAFSRCHFLRGARHYTCTQTHTHSIWNKIQIQQWKRCDSSLLCLLLGLIPRMRANLRREVDFWVLIILLLNSPLKASPWSSKGK